MEKAKTEGIRTKKEAGILDRAVEVHSGDVLCWDDICDSLSFLFFHFDQ